MLRIHETNPEKPILLVDCIAMYVDHIKGNNTVYQHKKEVSLDYINDSKRYLKEFKKFLEKDMNLQFESLTVDFINEFIVGKYCEYIEETDKSISTMQHYIVTMRTFYNYLIKVKKYDIKNYFTGVTIRGENNNNKEEQRTEIVDIETLNKIIPHVTREKGLIEFRTKKNSRNQFRPYLVDGFRLSAFTGRRCTEVCYMKWSDVKYDSKRKAGYIITLDRKSTQLSRTKTKKIVFPPITKQLYKLLLELGYKKYKGQDRFIIAGDDNSDRKTISKNLSKGFTHFVKFINSDKHLMLKGLRKNYITRMNIFQMGGSIKTEDITGHSDFDVIDVHYLDRAEKALKISSTKFKL